MTDMMKHIRLIYLLIVLVCPGIPHSGITAEPKGWTKAEAGSKIGKRVEYRQHAKPALLQWGPVKKKGRPVFRKPVGRGVKTGSTGTVVRILKSKSGYEVIVEWDADAQENEVWESGLYKDNYGLVTEILE